MAARGRGAVRQRGVGRERQLTPLVDARLRWQLVEQTGIPLEADPVTARIRSGLKADSGPFQALVEPEATLALVERDNSGTNGLARYPLIVDPQTLSSTAPSSAIRHLV